MSRTRFNTISSCGRRNPVRPSASYLAMAMTVLVAVLVVAPPATAGGFKHCKGAATVGAGSKFQARAHDRWRAVFRSRHFCGRNAPEVSYKPVGDLAGMEAFGLRTAANPLGRRSEKIRFVAVDEAPTPLQKLQIEQGPVKPVSGLDKTDSDDGVLHTIPVATGAIVAIVNFPHDCAIPAALSTDSDPVYTRFSRPNAELEKAYAGDPTADTWGEMVPGITGINGKTTAACESKRIVRIARFDQSSHTNTFKQWLHTTNGARGWTGLANSAWPNDGGATTVLKPAGPGPGPVAHYVESTDGSIGYADLSTARNAGFRKKGINDGTFWLPVFNTSGALVEPPTKDPDSIKTGKKGANCGSTVAKSRWQNVPGGADPTLGDWSPVHGAATPVGYPLCTLTYILAWDDYHSVYPSHFVALKLKERRRAVTVWDYLYTIVSPPGQSSVQTFDYFKLPTSKHQNLLTVARNGVNAIDWNK